MAITMEKIIAVQKEMDRLQKTIEQLEDAIMEDGVSVRNDTCLMHYPKQRGAIHRASMDLSRKLVDLRRKGD